MVLTENRVPLTSRPARRWGWPLLIAVLVVGMAVALLVDSTPDPGTGPTGRVGEARVTVADTDHPTIAGLDPALRDALAQATSAAADDGVEVLVTSGWRSREYQAELLAEAVREYGSQAEAARWVASPETSRHVHGEAVDVGPTDAAYWMAEHGARFGLCQVFANEIWHYELLTTPGGACPELRADGSA